MAWIIVLIVMLVLIVLFLIGFSIIFITKRVYRGQDYLLKTKFNYLDNNSIGTNLKSIQNLVNNNLNLQPILEYLQEKDKNYGEQLKILKTQLTNNSKLLKIYSLISIHQSLKQAKRNVDLLQEEYDEFKKYTLNTEEYSNYVSKLSVDLFSIISDIKNFFVETTLNLTFDDLMMNKKILEKIDETTENINIKLNYINSMDIDKYLVNQIVNIKELFKLYNELFEIEKYVTACQSLIDMIKSQLDTNTTVISNIEEVEKYLDKSTSFLDDIKNRFERNSFEVVKKKLRMNLEELETIHQKITLEKSYKMLFDKYFFSLKESASYFYSILNNNSIKSAYESILENFKHDQEICELTENNINLTNNICYKLDQIDKTLKTNKLDYASNVRAIYEVCEMIISFKDDNEKLYKLTHKKYDDFLKLSLKLADLDIKLFHIAKLMKNQKIKNNEIIKKAEENRELIDIINREFVTKYNSEKSMIEQRIKSVEDFLNVSLDAVRRELVLKELYNLLRIYANRYFSKERQEELAIIDNYGANNNYEAAIKNCIEFINKYKKLRKVA